MCAAESGEHWWLSSEADGRRDVANRQFDQSDSWETAIAAWLDRPSCTRTTVGEVLELALRLDVGQHDRGSQMRVAAVLKRAGWVRRQEGTGTRFRYYERPCAPTNEPTSELTNLDYEY